MTANPTTSPADDATGLCNSAENAEWNASLRLPVLTLFLGATFWLIVSSVFALIASIKFHAPGFLADCEWFTYGRVHAAHLNALAYGFAAQAGLGVTFWLLVRTGRTRFAMPVGTFIAAKLWNLGVLVGVGSILGGYSTGFEFLEFSQAGSVILFFAYLLLALAGGLTFARRAEDSNCISQWFLVAALFWFPWIYMTATALLGCMPVRGMAQAAIAWWFANNFIFVWLGLIGLGALFYFVPKFSDRPLHSRQLALFAFWLLVIFGSWAGIPASAPLPAWLPTLSSIGAMFSVVMLFAVTINLKQTCGKCLCTRSEPAPKFIGSSFWAFAVFVVGSAITSFAPVSEVTNFTWITPALTQTMLYGFVAMLMFGAIYHIAPQLTQTEYICTKPLKIHYWLTLIGIVLLVGSLTVAGIKQGKMLNDSTVPFAEVTRQTLMLFRMSTLGDLLILCGGLTLLFNLGGLLRGCCKLCGGEPKAAEVKQ